MLLPDASLFSGAFCFHWANQGKFARDWPAYPCSNVLLHYQNQDTSSSFLVKCRLFFFLSTFVCLIDISWSQFALWPFLFSYISDHLPSKMTCFGTHPFKYSKFCFVVFVYIFPRSLYAKCTWLFNRSLSLPIAPIRIINVCRSQENSHCFS